MLTDSDYLRAADALDCDVAAIQAVADVEAPKGGFNPDGSLVILFEGHLFYRHTKGAYAATHPDLCFPKWTRQFYGKNQDAEWMRFLRAKALDGHAARLSTSWGKFQILGQNHAACGFATVEGFVAALESGEAAHLKAFVAFLKHEHLDAPLREGQWAAFARGYNGKGYADNQYDVKLAAAYARHRT